MPFSVEFLKIYDKKINSGEVSFRDSGIQINDFNQMCIVPDFVMPEENLEIVCAKMKLSEEEIDILYREAGYTRKNG